MQDVPKTRPAPKRSFWCGVERPSLPCSDAKHLLRGEKLIKICAIIARLLRDYYGNQNQKGNIL